LGLIYISTVHLWTVSLARARDTASCRIISLLTQAAYCFGMRPQNTVFSLFRLCQVILDFTKTCDDFKTYKSGVISLRFLPPNMAALFGPAIGARNSRQQELGHTAHRALARQRSINNFILFMPLILLYYYSDGCSTGPITAVRTPPPGWGQYSILPTNSPTNSTLAPTTPKYH
jgi:hypothetical protein